jgi:hypothetical protein
LIRIYVNRRRAELARAILMGLPSLAADSPALHWVSPLECSRFREYRDGDFLRTVGLGRLEPGLRAFWPTGGACWDALAVVDRARGKPGVLLVEAKSYPAEMRGGGTKATPTPRERIVVALAKTQAWLGLPKDREQWTGELYQSANRLAHLYFLRRERVDAWLVNLYIVDDPRSRTTKREREKAVGSTLSVTWSKRRGYGS